MMTSLGNDVLRARLQSGAEVLASGLDAAQIDRLMDFLALLQKWNRVYNLTALQDPQEMLTQHLLDSLAALAPLGRHLAPLAHLAHSTGLAGRAGPGRGAGAGRRASALARCGFGRWPAWRGVCHLLPAVGCALRRQRGQEGRFHWAGGVAAQAAQPAWRARAGRNADHAVRDHLLPCVC